MTIGLFASPSRTIVSVLSGILIILGFSSAVIGIYTFVKTKDEPFFDAFLKEGFESDDAFMYMAELRLEATPFITQADLKEAYDAFKSGFKESVIQMTVVEHAWRFQVAEPSDDNQQKKNSKQNRGRRRAPKKNNKKDDKDENKDDGGSEMSNLKLSYFLEGFRDSALCEKDCQPTRRSSAEVAADYAMKRMTDMVDGIGESFGIEDASSIFDRRRVNDVSERRRQTEEPGYWENLMLEAENLLTGREDEYIAGFDTAQAVKDFKLNWIVLVVFGVVLLILGMLSCSALESPKTSAFLAFAVYLIGFFCLFQYGQSQGWAGMDGLTKGNFGGVSIQYDDGLRDNEIADKTISALMGFYKPYYLIIAFVLFAILGSTYVKLACCPLKKKEEEDDDPNVCTV